jgi:hypothetical protein
MKWQDILLDPRILVTFILCAALGLLAVWLTIWLNRRRQERMLGDQRKQQEEAVSRILDSFSKSKDEIIRDYEAKLREQEQRLGILEKENARLKERLTQGGILGLFGGKQRDVVSALLLENEQLHELLAQKQDQLRALLNDLTGKLIERMDEQAAETARAIKYKQMLLSAFLQQEEAKRLFDRFISEGKVSTPAQIGPGTGETETKPTGTGA